MMLEKSAMETMRARHSVRKYLDKPVDPEIAAKLQQAVDSCNARSGLHVQLFLDEPEAFKANRPSYGDFSGCRNYLAVVSPKGAGEEAGYYGQLLVLRAQELGLNTCWVGMSYNKGGLDPDVGPGEKLHMVIALGYGETQGRPRKSKAPNGVSNVSDDSPQWFKDGVEAALLAPTAKNQQGFYLELAGDKVRAKSKLCLYPKVGLGIVKRNFELGSGRGPEVWA